MSHRSAQIAGIIRSVVATHALRIPPTVASVVSVVDVRMSADLSYADIDIAAVHGVEQAIASLSRMLPAIRKELAQALRMHRLPLLRFHPDHEGPRVNRLDQLLASLEGSQSASKKRTRSLPASSQRRRVTRKAV